MKIERNKIVAVFFVVFVGLQLTNIFQSPSFENFSESYKKARKAESRIERSETSQLETSREVIEKIINENVWRKLDLMDLYGRFYKFLDKRVISDPYYTEIIKTDDGQLVSLARKQDEDIIRRAKKVVEFNKTLQKKNIPLLYVQVPHKLSANADKLPPSLKDYTDYNADLLKGILVEAGVDFLDLRTKLTTSKSMDELFMKTDHHWKIETSFEAASDIEKYLNNNYGFNIDKKFYDPKNYNKKILKNSFLGSLGRRVGQSYAGVNDFTLITPNFETDFTVSQINKNNTIVTSGKFEKAVLRMKYLKGPVRTNRYAVYPGEHREFLLKNNLIEKGKVLIIKSSSGNPVSCFMSLGLNEVRTVDPRRFKNESILKLIDDTKPDIVILLHNASTPNDAMFEFN